MKPIKIFGEEIIDQKAINQLKNCLIDDSIGVITADAHFGYNMPVGGCVAYKNKVSPAGVGFDIGCGNKAVRLNVLACDIDTHKVMDEIYRRISFGVGRPNNEKVKHEIFSTIQKAEFRPQAKMMETAKAQLGTVGSGNHFVDLFKDTEGYLWVGVHFGSRGFGHKTATGFLALAQGLEFTDKPKQGGMEDKPILLDLSTDLGQSYMEAMNLAGKYAYAGRDVVVDKVREILGFPQVTFEVHNHHNFAWMENHFGEEYCVVRKGCTPAAPGQYGFIGANMRDNSVIIRGIDSKASQDGLYSTVHGAGRILSRTQAAGKKKWIKNENGRKIPTVVGEGCVDFNKVKIEMGQRQIELRGAGADEAPECYKSLAEVLAYQGLDCISKDDRTIVVEHVLTPIGVAMAGDEFDPYKD